MRFIIIMALAYLAFKFLKGYFAPKGTQQVPKRGVSGEDLVEDPYCHTYIPLSNAVTASVHGKAVYFCSKKCREAFMSIEENRS